MTTLEVKENFQVCTWAGSLFGDQKRGHHPIISEDIHPLASVVGSIVAKSHEHMLGRTGGEKKKISAKGKQRPRELSYISDFVLRTQPLSHVQLFCVGPHELYPTRLLCPCDFPARILECAAISFSRGSSWPRDRTCVPCFAEGFFTTEAHISDLNHVLLRSSSLERTFKPFSPGVYFCLASNFNKQTASLCALSFLTLSLIINFVPVCTIFASLKHVCFQMGKESESCHF